MGERYTSDRDWADEDGYPGERDYSGQYGGDYGQYGGGQSSGYRRDEDRWGRGNRGYGERSFGGSNSSGMSRGGPSYGSGFEYDEGRGFAGEYGQQYSREQYGQRYGGRGGEGSPGGYGRNQGDYGPGYGESQWNRGASAQGHYGGGQYERGGQYWPGESSGSEYGSDSSQFGRGQYDYGHGHGGQQPWGRQNYSGRGPKGYQRSDDRLKEQASDALMDDPQIDASEITIDVSNAEATLTGTVGSREQKRAAEWCVERVSGVREVINQLRVSHGDSQPSGTQSGRSGSTSSNQTGRSGRTTTDRET